MELSLAIDASVSILEGVSGKEIVEAGWKFDPPKVLSDVFESVLGAILVDSGYDYDKTVSILEHIMSDVLDPLSPSVARDPVSDLVCWMASQGCTSISFQKRSKKVALWETSGIAAMVHGVLVVGPIVSSSFAVARFVAAERALAILKDPESEKCLVRICSCSRAMAIDDVMAVDSLMIEDEEFAEPADDGSSDTDGVEEVDSILNQFEDSTFLEIPSQD